MSRQLPPTLSSTARSAKASLSVKVFQEVEGNNEDKSKAFVECPIHTLTIPCPVAEDVSRRGRRRSIGNKTSLSQQQPSLIELKQHHYICFERKKRERGGGSDSRDEDRGSLFSIRLESQCDVPLVAKLCIDGVMARSNFRLLPHSTHTIRETRAQMGERAVPLRFEPTSLHFENINMMAREDSDDDEDSDSSGDGGGPSPVGARIVRRLAPYVGAFEVGFFEVKDTGAVTETRRRSDRPPLTDGADNEKAIPLPKWEIVDKNNPIAVITLWYGYGPQLRRAYPEVFGASPSSSQSKSNGATATTSSTSPSPSPLLNFVNSKALKTAAKKEIVSTWGKRTVSPTTTAAAAGNAAGRPTSPATASPKTSRTRRPSWQSVQYQTKGGGGGATPLTSVLCERGPTVLKTFDAIQAREEEERRKRCGAGAQQNVQKEGMRPAPLRSPSSSAKASSSSRSRSPSAATTTPTASPTTAMPTSKASLAKASPCCNCNCHHREEGRCHTSSSKQANINACGGGGNVRVNGYAVADNGLVASVSARPPPSVAAAREEAACNALATAVPPTTVTTKPHGGVVVRLLQPNHAVANRNADYTNAVYRTTPGRIKSRQAHPPTLHEKYVNPRGVQYASAGAPLPLPLPTSAKGSSARRPFSSPTARTARGASPTAVKPSEARTTPPHRSRSDSDKRTSSAAGGAKVVIGGEGRGDNAAGMGSSSSRSSSPTIGSTGTAVSKSRASPRGGVYTYTTAVKTADPTTNNNNFSPSPRGGGGGEGGRVNANAVVSDAPINGRVAALRSSAAMVAAPSRAMPPPNALRYRDDVVKYKHQLWPLPSHEQGLYGSSSTTAAIATAAADANVFIGREKGGALALASSPSSAASAAPARMPLTPTAVMRTYKGQYGDADADAEAYATRVAEQRAIEAQRENKRGGGGMIAENKRQHPHDDDEVPIDQTVAWSDKTKHFIDHAPNLHPSSAIAAATIPFFTTANNSGEEEHTEGSHAANRLAKKRTASPAQMQEGLRSGYNDSMDAATPHAAATAAKTKDDACHISKDIAAHYHHNANSINPPTTSRQPPPSSGVEGGVVKYHRTDTIQSFQEGGGGGGSSRGGCGHGERRPSIDASPPFRSDYYDHHHYGSGNHFDNEINDNACATNTRSSSSSPATTPTFSATPSNTHHHHHHRHSTNSTSGVSTALVTTMTMRIAYLESALGVANSEVLKARREGRRWRSKYEDKDESEVEGEGDVGSGKEDDGTAISSHQQERSSPPTHTNKTHDDSSGGGISPYRKRLESLRSEADAQFRHSLAAAALRRASMGSTAQRRLSGGIGLGGGEGEGVDAVMMGMGEDGSAGHRHLSPPPVVSAPSQPFPHPHPSHHSHHSPFFDAAAASSRRESLHRYVDAYVWPAATAPEATTPHHEEKAVEAPAAATALVSTPHAKKSHHHDNHHQQHHASSSSLSPRLDASSASTSAQYVPPQRPGEWWPTVEGVGIASIAVSPKTSRLSPPQTQTTSISQDWTSKGVGAAAATTIVGDDSVMRVARAVVREESERQQKEKEAEKEAEKQTRREGREIVMNTNHEQKRSGSSSRRSLYEDDYYVVVRRNSSNSGNGGEVAAQHNAAPANNMTHRRPNHGGAGMMTPTASATPSASNSSNISGNGKLEGRATNVGGGGGSVNGLFEPSRQRQDEARPGPSARRTSRANAAGAAPSSSSTAHQQQQQRQQPYFIGQPQGSPPLTAASPSASTTATDPPFHSSSASPPMATRVGPAGGITSVTTRGLSSASTTTSSAAVVLEVADGWMPPPSRLPEPQRP